MKQENGLFKANGTNYLVPFILITTLFFLWGFARAILDVLNKHFQNEMHISITESSLIQVTTYMGYFLMAIPAGLFINYLGYRRGVVFGLLLFGIGSLLFVPCTEAGTLGSYLFALAVISIGLVFLETAANPYVTELGGRETASSRLNLSQSFNGLGCLFATFAVGQFLFSDGGGSVAVPYVILGVVVLVIAAIFSRVHLPEIEHHDGMEQKARYGREPLKKVWGHKYFVYGLIALLCYEVAEISINSYFINYVTGMGWMDDRTASMVLTAALGFFMGARMHATIAAFSAGVPVVPMAYSRKFNGLFVDTLKYDHIIDLKADDESNVLMQVEDCFVHRDSLKHEIAYQLASTVTEQKESLLKDIQLHASPPFFTLASDKLAATTSSYISGVASKFP